MILKSNLENRKQWRGLDSAGSGYGSVAPCKYDIG